MSNHWTNEKGGLSYLHRRVEVHILSERLLTSILSRRGFGGGLNGGTPHLSSPNSFWTPTKLGSQTPIARVRRPASEAGTMPVPAGYLSDSPAAASASSASLIPPPPINTQQPGVVTSLLYSGSKFRGHQKSKGNSYDVEVVLQVRLRSWYFGTLDELSGGRLGDLSKWLTAGKSMSPGPCGDYAS